MYRFCYFQSFFELIMHQKPQYCYKSSKIITIQALHFQWFLFWVKCAQIFLKKNAPKICKCFRCSVTSKHWIFGSFWRSHVHHINFEFTQFGLMPTITQAHNSLGNHSIELKCLRFSCYDFGIQFKSTTCQISQNYV